MSVYDELLTEVTAIDDLKVAIVAFVNGQNARLDDLQAQLTAALAGDPANVAMVTEAITRLKADAAEVSTAITAGTPVA